MFRKTNCHFGKFNYSFVLSIISFLVLTVGAAEGYWIKVNDSTPLDNSEMIPDFHGLFYTAKNAQGDLFYFFNYDTMGTVAGRFGSGGANPTLKWEVYENNAWSNDPNVIATSISRTMAHYYPPLNLYPLPDSNEGLFGVTSVDGYYSTGMFDTHGFAGNIMYDPNNGWRQYKSDTTYDPYYISTLMWGESGIRADFAFDPDSGKGILVGNRGNPYDCNDKLAAARYDHNDANQRWHRWDTVTGNWVSNLNWPGYKEVSKYHILDPNAGYTEILNSPRIAHLGSGDYLVTFSYKYSSQNKDMISAARYNEGNPPTWSWWNGSGWTQGGTYNYSAIVNTSSVSLQKLLAVDEGLASFFYVRSGHVYELIYDERGQSPPSWGASTDLCASGNYTVSMDSDKAVWLYYTKSSDPNVYVRKKTFGGSWSSSAVIYQTSGTLVEVISANFVDDNIPVCFIAETVNNVKRIYAISDSNHSSYWSGETPLVLKSPPAKEKLDARIHWQNQVSIDFPGLSYPEEFPGHLSMDSEGYLYCPRSAVCNTIVRHKDELDPSNAHTWGVFWDHFIHPGGCAVDNVRGKVYIPDGLLSGGSGGGNIGGWGRIQAFDIAKRTENLGYNPGFGTLPPQCNQAYSPQYVGGAVWPGDVAVDEAHGLLYVTASIEGKIDVYDVENTVNYTGQNNRWPRSNLESGISVSDLPYVQNIINALISEPNDPDVYLIEYASDPNCVYWDPNSESLDNTISFVKGLSDYNYLTNPDRFIRQLSACYKNYWDRPVYLRSIGSQGSGNGQFRFPQGIDTDLDGNLYVADTVNHRIQKFDPNGDFVTSWGAFGYGEGEFIYPFSVAADPYSNVYVTDPFNHRVQIFDKAGNFIYSWGYWDSPASDKEFSHTYGIVADGEGNIFIGVEKKIAKFCIAGFYVDDNANGIPDVLDGSKYAIWATSDGHSAIEPSEDNLVDPNGSQTFTITCDEGYLWNVFVDGISVGVVSQYEFSDVSEHHTIEVATGKVQNITHGNVYEKIQDAINDANNGDVIVASPRTYNESINFGGKDITVKSKDPNNWAVVSVTIIDSSSSIGVAFTNGEGPNAILSGFTVQGGTWYGILCGWLSGEGNPTISNCIITGNDRGVYCYNSSPKIINNIIKANITAGIYCDASQTPVIENNLIYDNNIGDCIGIAIESATDVAVIRNNTIVNNSWGIYTWDSTDPNIANCIFWNNTNEDFWSDSETLFPKHSCLEDPNFLGDPNVTHNISEDPLFYDSDANNFHLSSDSPCKDAGNPNGNYDGQRDIDNETRVANDRADIGADEYYVSPADLDENLIVNLFDYAILTDSNSIDVNDLALLCEDWLWQAGWLQDWGQQMMMGQSMLESTLSINQTESSAETLEIPDLISKLQEIISDEESTEQLDCDKLQDIIADLEGMLEE